MTSMHQYSSLDEILAAPGMFYVWMDSYMVSHGSQMTLSIHNDDVLCRGELYARDCSYWRGPLKGGPYRLGLESVPRKDRFHEWTELRFFDQDGGFELFCSSIVLSGHFPPRPK